jgi:hypothetical protein
VLIDGTLGRGLERLTDRLLSGIQQPVHPLVVSQVRPHGRRGAQRGTGGRHRQRQVVIDVRIHASEGELDRLDRGLPALLDQRPPGQRHRRRVTGSIYRVEVQAGEGDVELGHERRISEEARAQLTT